MANFYHRSSSDDFTGSGYRISGLGNSFPFYSNPFGFEYFFNHLFLRLKEMFTSDPFLLHNFTFSRTVSQSKLQDIWRPDDIALLASTYKSLSLRLQRWFPLSSPPIFPLITHPFALKLFLSSLVSHFHSFHSHSNVPLSHFHPHEMDIVLASLRKLVLFLRSHSFCPIVYISLPPCSSVSTFVAQFSFLAHLIPFPPSTRTGTDLGYFPTGPRAGHHVFAAAKNEARVAAETRPGAQCQAWDAEAVLPSTSVADDAEATLRHDGQAVTPVAASVAGRSDDPVRTGDAPVCVRATAVAGTVMGAGSASASACAETTPVPGVASEGANAGADTPSVHISAGVGAPSGCAIVCVASVFAGGESVCSVPPSCKERDAVCTGGDTVQGAGAGTFSKHNAKRARRHARRRAAMQFVAAAPLGAATAALCPAPPVTGASAGAGAGAVAVAGACAGAGAGAGASAGVVQGAAVVALVDATAALCPASVDGASDGAGAGAIVGGAVASAVAVPVCAGGELVCSMPPSCGGGALYAVCQRVLRVTLGVFCLCVLGVRPCAVCLPLARLRLWLLLRLMLMLKPTLVLPQVRGARLGVVPWAKLCVLGARLCAAYPLLAWQVTLSTVCRCVPGVTLWVLGLCALGLHLHQVFPL